MKVLIAEDDRNIRAGLEEILQDEGYETVVAEDGTQALALFRSESPNFICLDIMMPGVDGYEVCREIRRADPAVPIIFTRIFNLMYELQTIQRPSASLLIGARAR